MIGTRRPPLSGGGSDAINAYGDHRNQLIRKKRPDNAGSKLLTSAENQLLFETLGANRVSMAAAVVQLLKASRGEWKHVEVGVLSLVKDYDRKLYTLTLFDIYNGNKLWEQILYRSFMAKSYPNCRKLLSFESDDCVYGLNFSDEVEALSMRTHLERRHEAEKNQRGDIHGPIKTAATIQRTPQQQKFQSPGFTDVGSTPHFSVHSHQMPPANTTTNKKKGKDAKKKKPKISKEDIGFPTNFEHKAHLGWDTEGGFSQHVSSSEPLDKSVIDLLKAAGENPEIMSSADLQFAREFVTKYHTAGPPPPVPQPTYPQSTLSRNGQQQRGFTLASMPPQHHMISRNQPPKMPTTTPQYQYSSQQNQYNNQQSPYGSSNLNDQMAPPPAPARDSSMHSVQQPRHQQQPTRPPPPVVTYQTEKPMMTNYEQRSYQSPAPINSVPPMAPPMVPPVSTTNIQVPVAQRGDASSDGQPGTNGGNLQGNAGAPDSPSNHGKPTVQGGQRFTVPSGHTRPTGPPAAPPPPPTQSAKPAMESAVKVSNNAPKAPPPPPMIPSGQAPSTASKPNGNTPSAPSDGRSNLLAEIQAGRKLKHVSPPVEKSGIATGKPTNERDQMMEQIKQGAQLKHIDQTEVESNRKSVPNVSELGGIAGALARALEERRDRMNMSEDSEDSDGNDSEWND